MKYLELDVASLLRHTSSIAALAELTGLDRRLLHRRCHSGLSISEADQCATAVGCHPSEVWACWFDLMDAGRRAKNAERTRRYRATAKGREATRRANRAHYQRAAAYYIAQAAKWRAENPEKVKAAAADYYPRRDVERRREVNREASRRYRAKKAAA